MGEFNRSAAVEYAARWWQSANPQFRFMTDDCTNFVSQCLLAGGHAMVPSAARDQGWWYRHAEEGWSYSWAVAHSLRWFLVGSGRAEKVSGVDLLRPGDLIFYDWMGSGNVHHTAIVVDIDPKIGPLVAAHTAASFRRPWPYTTSPAYTPQTRYVFMRLRENYPG